MNNTFIKQLGSIMIITGTELGAGILALPIITAKLGFILGSITMFLVWCLMTYTALLIADISLLMPKGSSFTSITKQTIGIPGSIISWIIFLLLMYCISIAYISASASAFHNLISIISVNIWSIIFVIILGSIVVIGISAVDLINRILLVVKIFFFNISLFIISTIY